LTGLHASVDFRITAFVTGRRMRPITVKTRILARPARSNVFHKTVLVDRTAYHPHGDSPVRFGWIVQDNRIDAKLIAPISIIRARNKSGVSGLAVHDTIRL
jgi:hypothetical protein